MHTRVLSHTAFHRPTRRFESSTTRKDFALRHIAPGISRLTEYEIVKGEGSWLTTSCGKRLLDFASGIGVTNLGHSHPHLIEAVKKQVELAWHLQVSISFHSQMIDLIEKLIPIMPDPQLDTFFFWNSGAEAVEAAIKLARQATKKQNIIVFDGSYHGRTYGTMALTTSNTIYRSGFGPFMNGVHVAPFPRIYQQKLRYGQGYSEKDMALHALEDLEMLLRTQSSPADTAAFLIEPIQGEGGYVPVIPEFLVGIQEIAKKHGILLIVDEVQSGFGRTGKYFAVEHFGVVPDILVFAKGVASGLPLSGIVSTQDLMSRQPKGSMGGTFAGNAVSCAAAIATLEVFQSENILENVLAREKQLNDGLKALSEEFSCIKDIRGKGLMIGVEFNGSKAIAGPLTKKCAEEGMLLLTCGVRDVVRLIPPLNLDEKDAAIGLDILKRSLTKVLSE